MPYCLNFKTQCFNTTHPWYNGHSISISAYEVWGVRAEIQVYKRELYTYIHLN